MQSLRCVLRPPLLHDWRVVEQILVVQERNKKSQQCWRLFLKRPHALHAVKMFPLGAKPEGRASSNMFAISGARQHMWRMVCVRMPLSGISLARESEPVEPTGTLRTVFV